MGKGAGNFAQGPEVLGSNAIGSHGLKPHRTWIAVAALIFAAGTAGSVFAGIGVAQNASQKSHKAFVASSTDISSTLLCRR
jgi:hypothetical protein